MAARAAAVMEMGELIEEFLLSLPPDDPAFLIRAALVCKLWRRILGSRGFRRRYRDFHRKRRLLGVIHFIGRAGPLFAPTSAFRPRGAPRFRYVHDSHHGRVLSFIPLEFSDMVVWDPITGEKTQLPTLQLPQEPSNIVHINGWNAAVLCASSRNSSGGHLDCDGGHFLVVFVSSSPHHGVYVCVYSSETGSWMLTASAAQHPTDPFCFDDNVRGTLAGSALHFLVEYKRRKTRICKYNVDTQEISWIKLPPSCSYQYAGCRVLLTSTHYGGLGCARLEKSLYLWSREAGSDGLLEWVHTRVIELKTLLPSINRYVSTATFVDGVGVGVFLVTTPDGLFSIDLDSNQVTKVCEGREIIDNVVPYMSFCNPARGTFFTGEEPIVGASSA